MSAFIVCILMMMAAAVEGTALVPGPALNVGSLDYPLLSNGSTWFVRFHASWCGACKASQKEWNELAHAPELPDGLKLASVDVDQHRALAEAFDVRKIPSYYVVAPYGAGVAHFDKQLGVLRFFLEELLPPRLETEAWRTTLWSNPLSLLWMPFVYIGVGVARLQAILATIFQLSDNYAFFATALTMVFLLAMYLVILYKCLQWCFPFTSAHGSAKKTKKE